MREPRTTIGEHGVTLLELLIVLMLMALIAGIAIPMVGGGVSSGLAAAAGTAKQTGRG